MRKHSRQRCVQEVSQNTGDHEVCLVYKAGLLVISVVIFQPEAGDLSHQTSCVDELCTASVGSTGAD